MNKTLKTLVRYLNDVLDVQIKIHLWSGRNRLPLFLLESYEYYETSLFQLPCLFMVAKESVVITPALIKKHRKQVEKIWDGLCIYVQSHITAYNRQRLLRHRIPFIIPGNQMYLLDLGIDLREQVQKSKTPKQLFSPATQAMVVYVLYQNKDKKFTPSLLAKELGYTLMTMSRVFDELETLGIGEIHRKGKGRWWIFKGNKQALWAQTKIFMRNPVKHRKWLKNKKPKIESGLSALAHYSMLSPPPIPVYAISLDEWKKWKETKIEELPLPEEAKYELEIWYYNPNLCAKKGIVDPFSLFLSLREMKDERIEIALEEMMEKIE